MEILLFVVMVSTAKAIARTGNAVPQRATIERNRAMRDSTFHRTNVPDDRC